VLFRSSDSQWMQLQESTAIAMVSLLEGCRDRTIPVAVANEFDFKNLFDILGDAKIALTSTPEATEANDIDQLEAAFAIVCFLLTIRDFVPDVAEKIREKADIMGPFEKEVGHIEINHDGLLERVFFRIPGVCNNLTEHSKQKVLWSVDRSGPGKKVEDFLSYSQDLEDEMIHQDSLKTNKFLIRLAQIDFDHYGILIAFWFALAINLIMFFQYTLPGDEVLAASLRARAEGCDAEADPDLPGACPDINLDVYDMYLPPGYMGLVLFLGFILTSVELIRLILFIAQFAKLIIAKGFRDQSITATFSKEHPPLSRAISFFWASIFLCRSTRFMANVSLFVFGIMGLFVSPLFFCVHLFNTVEISIDLQNVLRAVTKNGKSLAVTAIFGVMIVYLFAIWGFTSFRNHYETDDGDYLCLNLFQCTVVTLNGGLRKGDVGEIMQDTEWGNSAFIMFQFLYFALVITIMLNIIFGIIIDTFGELRQKKADTDDDILNRCFICSIDRYTFDRYSQGGFESHIKKEHNMWQYIFFVVHLNTKDPNQFTGPESYVKSMIDNGDVSWFPVNQAIQLAEHIARQEQSQRDLTCVVNDTATRTQEVDLQATQPLTCLYYPNESCSLIGKLINWSHPTQHFTRH